MNRSELLDVFTRQQRIDVEYPEIRREVDGPVVRHINLAGDDGFVIYSCLDEGIVEAAISAQIARFEELPQDFEWKVYDYDPPQDLVGRLHRRGFELEEPEALLVLDLTVGPAPLSHPVPASVARITVPDEVDRVVELENAVWGTDHRGLGESLKRDMHAHPEMLSIYISYHEGRPASAAWIYFHTGSDFASLWGGSTLPQYRGHGHYSHLLAVRAQEALARGFTLLSVDASMMSRPILEKQGFQYLAAITPCKWRVRDSRG